MAASWIWKLKRWMQSQQKNAADQYGNWVVALMRSSQESTSLEALEEISTKLLTILTDAVHDLDTDKLLEESFDSFRSILQIAMDVTRDRRAILSHTSRAATVGS
jgi:hypothetical protein